MHFDKNKPRTGERGQVLAEFASSLTVLFAVLFFMISLLSFFCGYISLNLACQTGAREAGAASSLMQASNNLARIKTQMLEGPLGRFGGVSNSALQLAVEQTPNGAAAFGPFDGTVNPDAMVYRYRVNGTCLIQPWLWPARVSMQSSALSIVEHPEGLGG